MYSGQGPIPCQHIFFNYGRVKPRSAEGDNQPARRRAPTNPLL